MIIKIHYSNCEDGSGVRYLYGEELHYTLENKIKNIITTFKKEHPFSTSASMFIEELRKYNIYVEELEPNVEVY